MPKKSARNTKVKAKKATNRKSEGRRSNKKVEQNKDPIYESNQKKTDEIVYNSTIGVVLSLLGLLLFVIIDLNIAGLISKNLNFVFAGIFSFIRYLIPVYLIVFGIFEFLKKDYIKGIRKNIAICLGLLSILLIVGGVLVDSKITFSFETLSNSFILSAKGNGIGILTTLFLMIIVPLGGKIFAVILGVLLVIFSLLLFNKFKIPSFFEYENKEQEGDEEDEKSTRNLLEKMLIADEENERFNNKYGEDKTPFSERVNIRTFEDENKIDNQNDKGVGLNDPETLNIVSNVAPPLNLGMDSLTETQKENLDLFQKGLSGTPSEIKVKNKPTFDPYASDAGGFSIDEIGKTSGGEDALKEELESEVVLRSKKKYSKYKLPNIDLLDTASISTGTESNERLRSMGERLERVLSNFNVQAKVKNIIVGPTVSRYEVIPEIGVKISSVKALESDLALNLGAKSVRVVAMHSESMIGIEAYNDETKTVTLKSIFSSSKFRNSKSITSFALGKNISGDNIISDLKNMPHLLIAGTTGSGKSVCINCILLSLLFKANPDELKFILIDPKIVELEAYNNLPHLLMPVINDADKASIALSYAVSIMEERYAKFSEVSVREIESYNNYVDYENKKLKDGDEEKLVKMPKIVIVIDELADLMMVASAKVQDSITRLAQKARACGINLIVATQQPLSSILTSVIKANIPSRIAFAVSSATASRVILDKPGAEKLLGNGDMLFSPIGTREPIRVQGAFVSDDEIRRVMSFIKEQRKADFSDEDVSLENIKFDSRTNKDELIDEVIEFVKEQRKASTSLIQRRFRIGYNRAANIIDDLEDMGIIGPQEGSRPRNVLI